MLLQKIFAPLRTGIFQRGIRTLVPELRKGAWIEHEGRVYVVHTLTSSHSGRGARHYVLTLRDVTTDSITSLKPSARDSFEQLDTTDVDYQFLYEADNMLHLLNPKTLEEVAVPNTLISPNLIKLLEGGAQVRLRATRDKPLWIFGGKIYKCTVAEIINQLHGAWTLMTIAGARVVAPFEMKVGDQIMVNAEDYTYAGKA